MLLPDIDWVTIPGGEFAYQEGEAAPAADLTASRAIR
jgi:hypothetical protein